MSNENVYEIEIKLSYSGSLPGDFIRWFTDSRFSHVDIVIPEREISSDFSFGRLIGSRPMQGVIMHDKTYPLEEHYVLSVNAKQYDRFWDFIKSQMASYYDWPGVITYPFAKWFGREWHNPDWWFCSELIAAGLQEAGIKVKYKSPHSVSPGDLTKTFKRKTE